MEKVCRRRRTARPAKICMKS
ncbi:hypothetical protein CCACVL1_01293 [Corchorus capsularis]|uniref:Uncharacterized protein n=1 Tax=Corchorus capsularis TaxID=210143 RepID=A0A1R3KK79_COCAP|nr:hypothetical protein CCACVL1_01293 [Corchorus capsularis]